METLVCSRCGKTERKRVVYGYPSAALLEQARRGEVVLGGCEIGEPLINWLCDKCTPHLYAEPESMGRRVSAEIDQVQSFRSCAG